MFSFLFLSPCTHFKHTIPVQIVQRKKAAQIKSTDVMFGGHVLLNVRLLSLGVRRLSSNAGWGKLLMEMTSN